jgi:hypothetical protein
MSDEYPPLLPGRNRSFQTNYLLSACVPGPLEGDARPPTAGSDQHPWLSDLVGGSRHVLVGASALAEWAVRGRLRHRRRPHTGGDESRGRLVPRTPRPPICSRPPTAARMELPATPARKTMLDDYWGISPRSPALSPADLPANESERHEA